MISLLVLIANKPELMTDSLGVKYPNLRDVHPHPTSPLGEDFRGHVNGTLGAFWRGTAHPRVYQGFRQSQMA